MARFARLHYPGAVVHVISRFVDGEYRLAGDAERDIYRRCLVNALEGTDWVLLAYALMGNHVHLVFEAGAFEPARLLKPLNVAVARRLNLAARETRRGPVFAERAKTLYSSPTDAGVLLAYVHNNPVRRQLAPCAAASAVTSHAALLGAAPPLPGLAVEKALALAGFDGTPAGRSGFDAFVNARAGVPPDPRFSSARSSDLRRTVRAATGLSSAEISSSVLDGESETVDVVVPARAGALLPVRWEGDLAMLLRAVAEHTGLSVDEIRARDASRGVVEARRLALVAGHRVLRRQVNEVAAALGITASAASKLLHRARRVRDEAVRIAARVRR